MRGVHSPKGKKISAAILGTEPRKQPSPRWPGFSPGPLRLHLRRQNRGVQNRPGSGLGVRATGAQLRAGAPTSRSRERATYTPAAGPAGTRPSFPKPGHCLRKVCAPSQRKVCARDAGAGRVLTPAGNPPPSPGHPTRLCRDGPQSRSAWLPGGPQQHPPTCGAGERGLTWALEEEVTEAGGWRGQPPGGAVRRLWPPDSCGE